MLEARLSSMCFAGIWNTAGTKSTFVKNFTDVDDKIIRRANEQHVPCEVITSKYIDAYYEDMGKLGIKPASIEPKATEHMAQIIELTDRLIKKGLAYSSGRRCVLPGRQV